MSFVVLFRSVLTLGIIHAASHRSLIATVEPHFGGGQACFSDNEIEKSPLSRGYNSLESPSEVPHYTGDSGESDGPACQLGANSNGCWQDRVSPSRPTVLYSSLTLALSDWCGHYLSCSLYYTCSPTIRPSVWLPWRRSTRGDSTSSLAPI